MEIKVKGIKKKTTSLFSKFLKLPKFRGIQGGV